MNKEFQYLQQIFQHIEDHNQGKQDLIEDLSCADCYPEDQNLGLLENPRFREFWQFVILPKYPTIRCTVILAFDTLVETIQFYWKVTDHFNNWEAYYSDQASNSASSISNMSGKENQKKTDNNDESSGSSQSFGGTGFTPNVQDKGWQNQQNEEGEKEETESMASQEMILKNGEDSGYSHLGIADTSNNQIYDPKKDEKDKQKAKTSVLLVLEHQPTFLTSLQAQKFYAKVASYLKGTALTWYNHQTITFWENDNSPQHSFMHLFKDHFCNPFRISQWKHQLRNRKQKQKETIKEYIAAITELWKRVDSTDRRMELDKIHEFIV
uniref:Retrotransposon gag domain-containing protein n=1 Tax=Rhizophagus irregularis (strain DAOM 181602 / DAOM 197198 / MUCL 43194) TaxID=747089 RepID=U9ULE2_RHIID